MRQSRLVIAGLTLMCLGLAGYWMIKDNQEVENSPTTKKRVEIIESTITGYENGVLSWEVQAEQFWAGRNRYLFRGEKLYDGRLYDSQGTLVIDQIAAQKVRVNTKSKTISAEDDIYAVFLKRTDRAKEPISISSGKLRYFSNAKKTELSHDVVFTKGDAKIYVSELSVDNDQNIVSITKPYKIIKNELEVTGRHLKIAIDDDVAELLDGVRVVRRALDTVSPTMDERESELRQSDTVLLADYLRYWSSGNDQTTVDVSGNVKIFQSGKQLTGTHGFYDKESGYFEMTYATLVADDLSWLLKGEQIDRFQNPDIVAAINMPVTLNARRFEFIESQRRLSLIGKVRIEQPDKLVTCKKLVFDDWRQLLTLEGNIRIIKDSDEQLVGQKIVLSLMDEELFAKDQIEAIFELKNTLSTPTKSTTP